MMKVMEMGMGFCLFVMVLLSSLKLFVKVFDGMILLLLMLKLFLGFGVDVVVFWIL